MKRASCVTLLCATNRKPCLHEKHQLFCSSEGFGVLSQFRKFNKLTCPSVLFYDSTVFPPHQPSCRQWDSRFFLKSTTVFYPQFAFELFPEQQVLHKTRTFTFKFSFFFFFFLSGLQSCLWPLSLSFLFVIPCATRYE